MKRIVTLFLMAVCSVCVVRADNFVGKYTKIYPLEDKTQLIVLSEDSIKKIIKQIDKEIEDSSTEEKIKNRDMFKKMKRCSMLFDFGISLAKEDEDDDSKLLGKATQLRGVLSEYSELLSVEMDGINWEIYAKLKKNKIKEMIVMMSLDEESRMILDLEFKKYIDLGTWKDDVGNITFNGQKLDDIINEESGKD